MTTNQRPPGEHVNFPEVNWPDPLPAPGSSWEHVKPPAAMDSRPRFVTENFAAAAARVPALEPLRHQPIRDSLAQAMALVDCMPGYELLQYVPSFGVRGGDLFVFRRLEARQ